LKFGEIAKNIMPFALMSVSVFIYLAAKKLKQRNDLFYWKQCILVFECVALLVFYLACNYFIVRESSLEYFNLQLHEGEDIPIAFVFYILTAAVPLFYVYLGLRKKDKIILWIGLVLIAIAALTFKNYFSLGHPEITLTIAGLTMISVAYFFMKYLKTTKHGITFEDEPDGDNLLKSNAEALLIAQSFTPNSSQQSDSPQFGGGGFGGGGTGSNY
jgi:uncharacterized membrane protein YgcG